LARELVFNREDLSGRSFLVFLTRSFCISREAVEEGLVHQPGLAFTTLGIVDEHPL
jgi:hypothetical protein